MKQVDLEEVKQRNERTCKTTIPHEVAGLVIEKGWNLAKAWKKYLGMSQKELAKKIGISQPALSRMECGDNLRDVELEKLAQALGLTPEQLVD